MATKKWTHTAISTLNNAFYTQKHLLLNIVCSPASKTKYKSCTWPKIGSLVKLLIVQRITFTLTELSSFLFFFFGLSPLFPWLLAKAIYQKHIEIYITSVRSLFYIFPPAKISRKEDELDNVWFFFNLRISFKIPLKTG